MSRKNHQLAVLIALAAASTGLHAEQPERDIIIAGYITHGVNVYNDQIMVDYSQVTPLVPWLDAQPKILEVGALAAGEANAERITAATDRSLPLATIRSFTDFFAPGVTYDPSLFNRPLREIGSNFFGFSAVDDRVVPAEFDEAGAGIAFYAKGHNSTPTVGDWDKASGQMRVQCADDGSATAEVTLRGAFPNAVYTLWEVGALNPGTPNEQGVVGPFGGLPNVLLTDSKGCGHVELTLPFCPVRSCDGESCTNYVSAFYHFDNQVYGGSPEAFGAGMPAGVVGSNHVVFPTTGVTLIEPQNRFSPRRAGCPGP